MTFARGRGVRVEIAATYASAKTVTAVTNANPGNATSTGHGLATKTYGYFATATGMPQLEGQACRLGTVTTNNFDLTDTDTTNMGTFTAGSFVPVSTWVTLASATDYNKTGGDASQDEVTVLLDDVQQNEAGLLSAESVSFTCRTLTVSDAALTLVRAAAKSNGYLVYRITLKDGSVRWFRGQPGLPTESLAVGSTGQTTFNTTVKGFWCEAAA